MAQTSTTNNSSAAGVEFVWFVDTSDPLTRVGQHIPEQVVVKKTASMYTLRGQYSGWGAIQVWKARREHCYATLEDARAAVLAATRRQ